GLALADQHGGAPRDARDQLGRGPRGRGAGPRRHALRAAGCGELMQSDLLMVQQTATTLRRFTISPEALAQVGALDRSGRAAYRPLPWGACHAAVPRRILASRRSSSPGKLLGSRLEDACQALLPTLLQPHM